MRTLLVANRGEIACRILRSARCLGVSTVAVYSDADANALHVAMADRAIAIGPAPAAQSYLDPDRLLAAAAQSGADAIHPGYGFLSENGDFAEAVQAAGLIWVGPAPATIRAMGDKETARQTAARAGLPIVPGSARLAIDPPEAEIDAAAQTTGFPLLIKAVAGGGGIGMRRADGPDGLAKAVAAVQAAAARTFGDGTVYLERYLPRARHIEVQVIGLGDGRAYHLHERDCSLQRRFQKVIEEAGAPGLPEAVRRQLCDAATALAEDVRYLGAGTVEFIVDAETNAFYFLEMNTRVQVEHPVSEMITGADIVAEQLRLVGAAGPAVQTGAPAVGHAIECRLYAENPAKRFYPSPGTLTRFDLPTAGPDLRIDTGYRAGDTVTPFYDPLLAKIITRGPTRAAAIDAALRALAHVQVEGIVTNRAFLIACLSHPEFAAGRVHTRFIDENLPDLQAAAARTTTETPAV